MDVVWIRLSTIVFIRDTNTAVDDIHESYLMFGPTGIVKFERDYSNKNLTNLYNSSKSLIAQVKEDPEFILDTIRRIRGTSGEKKQKKRSSKRKTSSSKKKK